MKNINTNPQKFKKMSIVALLVLIAIVVTSFVMARLNNRTSQETQEFIENLIAENENNPESVKYLITDNCISRVYPETEVEAFVTNFSEGEEVKVYTNRECTEEVTDGFVMSGMYAKYSENGKVYEISVLGDINEKASKTEGGAVLLGDGVLNQIDLTRDIRSCVDEEWKIDEEVEKKSGDVNCENQIDELSVKTIVDYIVYGDLNVEEVGLIAKPTVEVISGNVNGDAIYTSNVTIRIIENQEDALKTVYKITGDQVQGYKKAINGEEVELTENGIYKITAYTYGKLENKSKREYVIINIDKTADYTMEYYLEGEDGTYSKVEASTKVELGEIGQTVEIEQKQFTDYELDVDNVNGNMQGEVLEDGSLVLKAYYNRKQFTYTFEAGENITGVTAVKAGSEVSDATQTVSVTAKWGEKIDINAVEASEAGYDIAWNEWVNNDDATDKITTQAAQVTVGKANKTYTATATKTIKDYTIAYELNKGTLPTGITNKTGYTVETDSFTLNNPSRAGYEFKGWTGGTVNTQGQIDDTIPAGNTANVTIPTTALTVSAGSLGNRKYIANWEAITNTPYKIEHYKETLETGEFILAETENKGGTTDIEATAVAKTYEGFTFDQDNTNNVVSGTVSATQELVLKLYYTRNTYNLTIVAGNNIANISAEGEAIEEGKEGDSTVGKQQTTSTETLKYKYEQGVTLETTRQNVTGYTYQNITWESSNTDKIATTTELTNAQTASKEITMPAGNITITAKVTKTPIVYNITYNLNGGALPEGETNPATYTVESEDIEIKNLQDGTKLGYDFAGWTGSNGNVASKNVVIAQGSTGDKSYVANWTEATFNYTVEYYYEVANGYEIDASFTEHKTAKYNAQISQFTDNSKTGYELKEEPEAITISYTESENVLRVYYIKKTHTLTLQKDDNTIASVSGFGTYKYGAQVEISAVLKEIDGYYITWNKWESQTAGVGDNNNQTTTITIPDADVTLRATGTKTPIEYGISYMLNGGVETQQNPTAYTIESNDITLINPTKQGYVFAGWTGGTSKANPGTTGNVEEPTTTLTIETGSMGTRLYTANWVGDIRTPYTVEHYKENLDGTYPTLPANTDEEEGTTDEEAIANERTYEGFEVDESNANNVLTGIVKADGSLILKVYYKRKVSTIGFVAGNNIEKVSYSVKDGVGAVTGTSLTAEGTNLSGEFKYGTQINIGAIIEEETGHTTTWSSWESSATDKIVNQATQEALIGVPVGDVTLTAKATRTTNRYGYRVEYYYDNVKDNNKTVESEATYGSRISTYTNKNITGFELQEEVNKPLTITDNEETNVMKIYYRHINYTITYDLSGGIMPLVNEEEPEGERQTNPETYSVLSETFTLNNPEKAGYNFLGWTGTNGNEPAKTITIAQGSTGNRSYTANWRAKTDTLYTIEHYKEGLDGAYSKVNGDTEEAYGTTGTTVTTEGKIKTYTGFTHDETNENAVETGTVAGDGSLVLKVYYKRNEYTLSLVAGDNIESVKYTITNEHGIAEGYDLTQTGTNIEAKFKYGAEVSITGTLATEEHYNITNGKWTSSNTSLISNSSNITRNVTIGAGNVTLTASATKTGAPYTYYTKYYYENVLEHTATSTAAYNTQVTNYTPRTKTGYKFDKVEGTPLTISATEENNVIEVYYILENYTLTYNLDGGEMPLVDETEPEGERQANPEEYTVITPTFTLINPEKEGYNFVGWSGTGLTGNENTEVTIAQGSTGNRSYTANWQASTDTEYKVEYYIENVNSTENPESEEVDEANYTKYTEQGLQETYIGTTGETATAEPIEITGFTYNEGKSRNTITGTIAANGSLVLKVYYTRNNYKLKLVVGDDNISSVSNAGDISTTEIEKTYKYGKTVSIGAATATITGYTPRFDKWVSSNTALLANQNDRLTTVTIPAGDVTLTATGTREKAKFTYTVEYYYENSSNQMVKDDKKTVTGEPTDYESQILTYAEKLEPGYELDSVDTIPLTITATPVNNVIKVYYRLINYNLTYDLANGEMPLVNEEEPEGERQTNPATYTTKTENFTLNNPERDGYIFMGWTGGVVNNEQQIDDEAETGTTGNTLTPTRTLTINKGSIGIRKYTANWQERTYEVIVHHYLQGTGINNVPAVEVAEDEIFSTTTLGQEYTVYDLVPEYDAQGNITNEDESERNYLDGKEFYVTGNSGNTTGTYTREPIEVIFYYQYYPVVRIVSAPEPANSLNGTEYITIREALEALTNAGQTVSSAQSKLKILRNVKDETVVVNNLNIELDLNDYTVNSNAEVPEEGENPKSEPAIKLTNSNLTLVDGSELARGKLTSQNGSGVYVDLDSTFTLGIEERPVVQFPEIVAKTFGVEKESEGEGDNKQEGTFNFFDGKITAKTAIRGVTDLTPIIYNPTSTVNEDGDQVATLAIITGKEARIGRKTYTLLEDAIAAASTTGEQVEIVLLKDIKKGQRVIVPNNKNIKLNLDGYTLTTSAADYVLENQGKLEIVDSTATAENPYGNGKITSTTYDTVLNSEFAGEVINLTADDILPREGYTFVYDNGTFVNNNIGKGEYSIAKGTIELDLTEKTSDYKLVIPASFSLSLFSRDTARAIINNDVLDPDFDSSEGKIISTGYNTSDYNWSNTYYVILKPGNKYYLHLYYKSRSTYNCTDTFKINGLALKEMKNAELTVTSGQILNEKAGTSSSIARTIYNRGILKVGDKNNTTTYPYIRGAASYTRGILNHGITTIESGYIGGTSSSLVCYGKTTIENGTFANSVDSCYTSNILTVDGGEYSSTTVSEGIIIKDGTFQGVYANNNATIDIKGGTFNNIVAFNEAGNLIIEGGTFNSGYTLGYGTDNSAIGTITITGGTINRDIRGKANDRITINGGTVPSVTNEGNGYVEIISGTVTGTVKNSSSGTIDIKGGNLKYALNYTGTINISGGTFNSTGNNVNNAGSGTVNITGGTFTSTGTAINNDSTGTINIEKAIINADGGTGVNNKVGGTITLGKNDDEIDNDSLVISAVNGVGVANIKGTLNYYDGTVKGKIDKSIDGVSAIPEGKEIVVTFEGENDSVEVAKIGISTTYVAQIGPNNKYTTLQNAINAVSADGQETEITIIAPIYLSATCTVPEGKNVVIDVNAHNIKQLMKSTIFVNNSKLTIKDSANVGSTPSKIYQNATGRLFTNNGELDLQNIQMTINNVDGDYYTYYNYIVNNNIININGAYIYTGNHYINLIYNNSDDSKVTMNSGSMNIHSSWRSTIIHNAANGEVIINGGTLDSSAWAIKNDASGNVTINGGTVKGASDGDQTIYNKSGTIIVNNGTVAAGYGWEAIKSDNGRIEVNGGTISSYGYYGGSGITCNNGTLKITGGTFSSTDYAITANGSTNVEIRNASISCNRSAIKLQSSGTVLMEDLVLTGCQYNPVSITKGTITINNVEISRSSASGSAITTSSAATITATDLKISGFQTGIDNSSNLTILSSNIQNCTTGINNKGTLTLGTDDNEVKTDAPSISGTDTGVTNSGTFNYYDGVLQGKQNKSYIGTIAAQPEGYEPIRTYDSSTSRETTILGIAPVAINLATEERYVSLQEAIDDCTDNTEETIQLLREYNLASNADSITISADKIVKLDLNGYKINATKKNTFINNGDFEIINDKEGTTSSIVNSTYGLIKNSGTLVVTGVTLTTNGSTYTEDSETINVYNIDNSGSGNVTLDGVTIDSYYAINNNSTGTVDIKNSAITGNNRAIYNRLSGTIISTNSQIESWSDIIENCTTGEIVINSGSVGHSVGNSVSAIKNAQGKVTINGGAIYNKNCIQGTGNGIIEINGGTLSGAWSASDIHEGYAINVSNDTVYINGGTIGSTIGGSRAFYDNGGSNIYVTGGTFRAISETNSTTQTEISGGEFSKYIINRGTMAITGGTFTYNQSEGILQNSGTATISGGEFTTTYTGLKNSGTMTISKATITCTTSNAVGIDNSGTLTLAVPHDKVATDSIQISSDATGIRSSNSLTLGIKDVNVDNDSIQITAGGTAVNVSANANSKLYYYEGTLIASNIIEGFVEEVTEGYRIVKETVEDKLKGTIKPIDVIAMIGSSEYTTLQAAIDDCPDNTETTILITDSFVNTKQDIAEIDTNQNIIIDLDGHYIETHGGTLLTNNGKLKMVDNTTGDRGIITGYSNYLISNTGDIDLSVDIKQKQCIRVLSNTGNGDVKISGGSIIEQGNSYGNNYIIYSNTTSPIEITNASITAQSLSEQCKAIYGLGNVTVTGGSISISGNTSDSSKYSYIVLIGTNQENFVPTVTISGVEWNGTGTYGIVTASNVNANITVSSGSIAVDRYGMYLNSGSRGTTTISGGTISSTGVNSTSTIQNEGTFAIKVEGGTISYTGSGYSAIRANSGTLEVTDGTINGGNGQSIYSKVSTDIKGGTITSNNVGVYVYSGTTNITGGTITGSSYGIYVNSGTTNISDITINGNTYGIYMNNGTVNFDGGEIILTGEKENAYGVYINNGTLTIGKKEYPVNTTSPNITSYKYGVYHNGGTFNFYDGIINGDVKAIYGTVDDTPELFGADISDDEKTAILSVIVTFNDVAYYNSVYYDSLQAAIQAAENDAAVIDIQTDIVLTSPISIASGQNITLDMNGHSIIILDKDYAFINNGSLTIIDSVLTDATSTAASVIENRNTSGGATLGTAIYNATGATLTLGIEDATVHPYVPTIIGNQNAVENNGTFNMFDGILKAIDSPVGGTSTTFNAPTGYTYQVVTEDGIKVFTLKVIE